MTGFKPQTGIRQGLPRWVEAPLAVLGLVLVSPILWVAALAVALSSRGPILFRQERIGRGGRPFLLRKFRSMRSESGQGPQVTSRGDSRITRVGRFLRATKIDELPELWNIVVGDMSFVGPRPEVPAFVNPEDPLWQEVLVARPGLTDPVTLRLRNEEQLMAQAPGDREDFYRHLLLPWKLKGYRDYLRRRTAFSDLALIARTLVAIVAPSSKSLPTLEEIQASVEGFAERDSGHFRE